MDTIESVDTNIPNKLAALTKCAHGGCACTVDSGSNIAVITAHRWPTGTMRPATRVRVRAPRVHGIRQPAQYGGGWPRSLPDFGRTELS